MNHQIQNTNMGGLLALKIVKCADVLATSVVNGNVTVQLKDGAAWTEIELLEDGNFFRIDPTDGFDGTSYANLIQAPHPKVRPEADQTFDDFTGKDCLAALLDGNEAPWLFGMPEEPLRLLADSNSANQPNALNAYTIQIAGPTTRRPYPIPTETFAF